MVTSFVKWLEEWDSGHSRLGWFRGGCPRWVQWKDLDWAVPELEFSEWVSIFAWILKLLVRTGWHCRFFLLLSLWILNIITGIFSSAHLTYEYEEYIIRVTLQSSCPLNYYTVITVYRVLVPQVIIFDEKTSLFHTVEEMKYAVRPSCMPPGSAMSPSRWMVGEISIQLTLLNYPLFPSPLSVPVLASFAVKQYRDWVCQSLQLVVLCDLGFLDWWLKLLTFKGHL